MAGIICSPYSPKNHWCSSSLGQEVRTLKSVNFIQAFKLGGNSLWRKRSSASFTCQEYAMLILNIYLEDNWHILCISHLNFLHMQFIFYIYIYGIYTVYVMHILNIYLDYTRHILYISHLNYLHMQFIFFLIYMVYTHCITQYMSCIYWTFTWDIPDIYYVYHI